jgi:hypothetical protein
MATWLICKTCTEAFNFLAKERAYCMACVAASEKSVGTIIFEIILLGIYEFKINLNSKIIKLNLFKLKEILIF